MLILLVIFKYDFFNSGQLWSTTLFYIVNFKINIYKIYKYKYEFVTISIRDRIKELSYSK